MSAYKASIIIPVYNAEKTLRRCVESLALGQEKDIEILLIEDCSADGSRDLCMELETEFNSVKAIFNEHNSGVSFSRNRGLQEAHGKYVLFVDSDDWVSCQYVKKMLQAAILYKESLIICGLHFIDKVNNIKQDYLWNPNGSQICEVKAQDFFKLSDQFLLQQLWNKIFLRELIEKYAIRFDVNQNMGEDFQFVLDYLEATGIKQCAVVNEPLYYYIRWNKTSLISNFGLTQRNNEFNRIKKLASISGADAVAVESQLMILKRNYIYHLSRNPNLTTAEKLELIEKIMEDGKSRMHYFQQILQYRKENISEGFAKAKTIPVRVRDRLRGNSISARLKKRVNHAKPEPVSIISQNCIGGVLYHDLGMKFLSPTINLFFKEPDFVRFANNLTYYINCELQMMWDEEYPIGKLDDITVYFMHYDNCRDAKEAWNRRKERILWDKILVVSTDHEGFDQAAYTQWLKVPYDKILFTAHKSFSEDPDSVYYPEYEGKDCVPDLIPGREFYKDDKILNKIWFGFKSIRQ